MMSKKLVVANWKMHGIANDVRSMITAMRQDSAVLKQIDVSLCVPAVYLSTMASLCADLPLSWGAQNVCDQPQGAFTGEISASMLQDVGCQYVIVGHSERRIYFGEDNDWVARKWLAVKQAGLVPILCLGENQADKANSATLSVVIQQLDAVLNVTTAQDFAHSVIAYEPVWAIGTGVTPTTNEVISVHTALREHLIRQYDSATSETVRILYGGSVKADNAQTLLTLANVDGGLVGGASLKYDSFSPIYKALI